MSNPSIPFRIGDRASLCKTITEKDILSFANLVGDYNPVHLDNEYAKKTRFKGRIAHGVIVIGLISAVLGNKLPGPGTIYLGQTAKFLRPVRPGDTITATVEIVEIKSEKPILTLKTGCVNQKGDIVLDGKAEVLFEG